MKPSIAAPGVDILAMFTEYVNPMELASDKRRLEYAICYRPAPLNDRKRPNIARCELSLHSESLDSFHWRYPQVNMVSHLE
jgi:hypothetical protein